MTIQHELLPQGQSRCVYRSFRAATKFAAEILVSNSDERPAAVTGVITNRQVITPRNGATPPFTKATIVDSGENPQPAVWWNAGQCPAEGTLCRCEGFLRTYRGSTELHVMQTVVEHDVDTMTRTQKLLGFFRDCVEVEAANDLRLYIGSQNHVDLLDGPVPFVSPGPALLPGNDQAGRWSRQRSQGVGETVLCGYPMLLGVDPEHSESDRRVMVPLFVAEVELSDSSMGWCTRRRADAVDFNGFALDVLGIDRGDREEFLNQLEQSPELEEARSSEEQIRIVMQLLRDSGLLAEENIADLDPKNLAVLDPDGPPIQNCGVLLTSTGGAQYTRMLSEDLQELASMTELPSDGPLGVFLGAGSAQHASTLEVHPTVVHSSFAQDEAISSAMNNNFTVVTGPPGTGKSQVLVNVISAAVCRGESVLFASKNNQAVDVVFERMQQVSKSASVIRAGASSRRQEVALAIKAGLRQQRGPREIAEIRSSWDRQRHEIHHVHEQLRNLDRLEAELDAAKADFNTALTALPASADLSMNPETLQSSYTAAGNALRQFEKSLGWWGRKKRHTQRATDARRALVNLFEVAHQTGLTAPHPDEILGDAEHQVARTTAPLHRLTKGSLQESITGIANAINAQKKVRGTERDLDRHPDRWNIESNLAEANAGRVEAAQQLHDLKWHEILHSDPDARAAATKLAEHLHAASQGQAGARSARKLFPKVLPILPVWGVTNLAAKTNFPLRRGMFDLVIIDEASQCDAASAIPLLYRAKRALIIGDQQQLIHITQLGQNRERQIAAKWGLTKTDASEFSYRDRSCFGMANLRVGASPHLLDLHFRSQAAIAYFNSERFYGGQLNICTDVDRTFDEPTVEWRHVAGDCSQGPRGRSWINREEAQATITGLRTLTEHLRGLGLSLGVVTPYRAQVELLQDLANSQLGDLARDVTIDTVNRFQGDERDVMVFSPVVGPSMPARQIFFAANPNRINVALSRARKRLIVVGNQEACLRHDSVLADFARYVARLEANGFDSPLELTLYEALLEHGVTTTPGRRVGRYRLDLAIENGDQRLDIELDGQAFHLDRDRDRSRDSDLEALGWKVVRFGGIEITRNLDHCVDQILSILNQPNRLALSGPRSSQNPSVATCGSCNRLPVSLNANFCGFCGQPRHS